MTWELDTEVTLPDHTSETEFKEELNVNTSVLILKFVSVNIIQIVSVQNKVIKLVKHSTAEGSSPSSLSSGRFAHAFLVEGTLSRTVGRRTYGG
jgi:hypothetical protein